MAKTKVKCCDCSSVALASIPTETVQRAGEAGMTINDLLTATVAAHQTCCTTKKSAIAPGGFFAALIAELEALIAAFIPSIVP